MLHCHIFISISIKNPISNFSNIPYLYKQAACVHWTLLKKKDISSSLTGADSTVERAQCASSVRCQECY